MANHDRDEDYWVNLIPDLSSEPQVDTRRQKFATGTGSSSIRSIV